MTGLYGIVGGPNTGKTTTVGVFKERKYRVLEETATPIILAEKKVGGALFRGKILRHFIEQSFICN